MRLFILILLAVLVASCNRGTWSGKQHVPQGQWGLIYGTPNPVLEPGPAFDYGNAEPHALLYGHYGPITGTSITVRYKVTGGPVWAIEGGISGPRKECPGVPGKLAIHIQRSGDTMTGLGEFNYYRAYSRHRPVIVAGTHELTVSLTDLSKWVHVNGPADNPGEFARTLANAQHVGVVFGGCGGAAHGTYADEPTRFELLELVIE